MDANSYSKLLENGIRLHFERNGTLDEMRSGLHAKVLTMLHGEKNLKKYEPLCGGDLQQRGLLRLLNHLVVEYFDWYGYKHTQQTFALETGNKSKRSREQLRSELNDTFDRKELPILLQMVMKHVSLDNAPKSDVTSVSNPQNIDEPMPAIMGTVFKPINIKESKKKSKPHTEKSRDKMEVIPDSSSVNILRKVNVRQCMADPSRLPPSNHDARIRRLNAKKHAELRKLNRSNSDTLSTIESHDDDTEYSSETFADIPNRYYYRDVGPPEQKYQAGFGEEGPYEGPSLQSVPEKMSAQEIKRNKKSKSSKVPELSKKENNATKFTKPKSKTSDYTCPPPKHKFSSVPQRCGNRSRDDLSIKNKCPETMIGKMGLVESDDSDEFL